MIKTNTFSKNLSRIRKKKGLSQRDLAKISGISPRMIGHYETHVVSPPIEKIKILAETLKVSASELMGFKKTNDEIRNDDFDVRTIRKFRKLNVFNPQDRLQVYKLIDLLAEKPEYKEKINKIDPKN